MRNIKDKLCRIIVAAMLMLSSLTMLVFVSTPVSAQAYSVSLTTTDADKSVKAGETVQYAFTIKNTGTNADTYKITNSTNPTYEAMGWYVTLSQSTTALIYSGDSTVIYLTVYAPATASVGDLYLVTVTVRSETDPLNSSASVQTATSVQKEYGVSIETPPLKYADKGTIITYWFNVTNTGNTVDSHTVIVESYPSGWTAPNVAYSSEDKNPGEKTSVNASVYVPANALAGAYSTTIKAISNENNSKFATTQLITIVNQAYGVSVSVESGKYVYDGGKTVTYNVTIINTGNGYDTFNLNYWISPQSTTAGWSASLSAYTTKTDMAPGEAYNVTLYVTSPSYALANSKGEVYVNATSTGDTTEPIATHATKSTTFIRQEFDVTLSGITTNYTVAPGGSGKLSFNIRNTGNGEDRYTVDIVPPSGAWSYYIDIQPSAILAQDQIAQVNLTFTSPTDALEGNYFFTAYVNSTYSATTKAVILLRATVTQICGVLLEPSGPASTTTLPGTQISFDINVKNTGNGIDEISLQTVQAPLGWISYYFSPSSTVQVNPNSGTIVTYVINVPNNSSATEGTYMFKIRATSNTDSSKTSDLDIIVGIAQIYDVELTCGKPTQNSPPSTATELRELQYVVAVKNTGSGIDNVVLSFTTAPELTGYVEILNTSHTLAPGETKNSTVIVTLPMKEDILPGTYYVTVYAHTADTATAQLNLSITVTSIYKLELITIIDTKKVNIGGSVTFEIEVWNKGIGTDTFHFYLIENSSYVDLTASDLSAVLDLPPDTYVLRTLTIVVPAGWDPAKKILNVTIKGTSDKGGVEAEDTLTVHAEIAPIYDAEFTTDSDYKSVGQGGSVQFDLTLTNTGTVTDKYLIERTGDYKNWAAINYTFQEVPATYGYNTQDVIVTITVPDGTAPGDYPVTIVAKSWEASPSHDIEVANITLTAHVTIADVLLLFEQDLLEAKPTESVYYNLTVKNKGDSEDSYVLECTATLYSTWVIINPPTLDNVLPEEERIVNITVTPPAGTPTGEYLITITIKSSGAGDIPIDNVTLTLRVLQIYGVHISCPDLDEAAEPGYSVTYTITVKNEGNGLDIFDFTTWAPNPLIASWAVPAVSYIELSAGASAIVNVTVSILADEPPGFANISINATSRLDPDTPQKTDSLIMITRILQAYAVEIGPDQALALDPEPGETVTYQLTVENKGTGLDDIEIEKGIIPTDVNVIVTTEDAEGQLVTKLKALPPYEPVIIYVKITIGGTENHDACVFAIDIFAKSKKEGVADTATLTTTINPYYAVEVSCTFDTQYVTPHSTDPKAYVDYLITILNKGSASDSFGIDITGTHSVWAHIYAGTTDSITPAVDAGATTQVTIRITIPNNQPPEDFSLTVTVTSQGNTEKTDSVQLTTIIEQLYAIDIIPVIHKVSTPQQTGEAQAYREVTVAFKLQNKGTGLDGISWEVKGDYADWVPTKGGSVGPLNTSEVSATIGLIVEVPTSTAIGEYTFYVEANSQGDPTKTATQTFTIVVTEFYALTLTCTETMKSGKPGDTLTYTLTIKNKGNTEDTITFSREGTKKDWCTIEPSAVTLPPAGMEGATYDITVTIEIPTTVSEALADTYIINVTALSEDGITEAKIQLKVQVKQVYDVEVTTVDWTQTVGPETSAIATSDVTVEYKLKITNKGNGYDQYEVYISSALPSVQWEAVVVPATTRLLAPGETDSNITVKLTIPQMYVESENKISLTVASTGDPERLTERTYTMTVKILAIYSIELSVADVTKTYKVVPGGDPVSCEIYIKNNGNTDDTVELSATIPDQVGAEALTLMFGTATSVTLIVSKGAETSTTLTITAEPTAEPTIYSVRIEATSADGEVHSNILPISVEVIKPSLAVTVTLPTTAPAVEDMITVTATVENIGEISIKDLIVKFYDGTKYIGSKTIISLPKGEKRDVQIDFKVTEGTHNIRVEVIDTAGETIITKSAPSFMAKRELIPSEMVLPLVAILTIVIIILAIIAWLSASYKRGIPAHLREEIAQAKREARLVAKAPPKPPKPPAVPEKKIPKPPKKPPEEVPLPPKPPKKKVPPSLPVKKVEEKKPPVAAVKIKCPKCNEIQTVTSPKRPIEFDCSKCGMKLVLKK